jgi:AcrR family transcriptional regulator
MSGKQTHRPSSREPREESLERLLDAAEDQLREEVLDLFTVDRVLERAELSVGTFYRMFSGKQALLSAVQNRLQARMEPAILEALRAEEHTTESLEQAVDHALGVLIDHVWKERGLYRALMMLSAIDPVLRLKFREANIARRDALTAVLAKHREEIAHPDPDAAIEEAHHMLLTVMHGRLLFLGPGIGPIHGLSDELLFGRLKLSIRNYLCGYDGEGPRARPVEAAGVPPAAAEASIPG